MCAGATALQSPKGATRTYTLDARLPDGQAAARASTNLQSAFECTALPGTRQTRHANSMLTISGRAAPELELRARVLGNTEDQGAEVLEPDKQK